MGELLYLYLEEHNLLEKIANSLVVERNVTLISKNKSNEDAFFEGSRYFDEKDFRKYKITLLRACFAIVRASLSTSAATSALS